VPSPGEKQEDYYKGFRSGVVLFWMFCNLGLSALVLQSGGLELTVSNPDEAQKKANDAATIYLAVVLYSVAGLAAFRFIGAMWFLVVRMVSDPQCLQAPPTLRRPPVLLINRICANYSIVPRCMIGHCLDERGVPGRALFLALSFWIGSSNVLRRHSAHHLDVHDMIPASGKSTLFLACWMSIYVFHVPYASQSSLISHRVNSLSHRRAVLVSYSPLLHSPVCRRSFLILGH
jgi:hypothetical protein